MQKKTYSAEQIVRAALLTVVFLLMAVLLFYAFGSDKLLTEGKPQKWLYPLGMGTLLAALITGWLFVQLRGSQEKPAHHGPWFYPLLSGALALAGMSLAYVYMGIWPAGDKTGMIVDMHHQYAPLLSQLRDMLLHGGSPLYSFEVGLGASFLPMFAYYLASPFNLLLVFFPESLLPEGILLITLLKNALCAVFFAACVQYVYGRRSIANVVVSIMYSLMMYLLAYSWNIMWLDCIMVLPLIVMGFERLMRTGHYGLYALSLGYALFANYYIGFMVCIFMVIYYFAYMMRQLRTGERQARSFLRFAVGSLVGGGLAMVLLVPVALSLGQTSAAGGKLPELTNTFDMFNLLGRHLYETSPTIRSGNLPNIYCGILAVVLAPIFATMKSIPLRRRVTYLGMLGLLGMSFVLNQFDLIWHGLHAPNDLPYRFSFLYSFVLLLIAYETLLHIRTIVPKQIALAFFGIVSYIIIEERFGDEAYGFRTIYISLLLVALYAVILLLASRKTLRTRSAYALLLVVVATEMVLGAGSTFRAMNSKEYFTAHKDYVDNVKTDVIRQTVNKMEEIGDAAANGAFYRMEFLPRRTCVDTALFDYRGITVFASSNSYKATRFMGSLGYAINGVNSHLYRSFVAPSDSLLGIRYVALENNITAHPQLKQLDSVTAARPVRQQDGTVTDQTSTLYIYENPYALPVGFLVRPDIKTWTYNYYSPLDSQNSLFAAMTGDTEDMYTFEQVQCTSSNASVSGTHSISINAQEDETATFEATVTEKGQYFFFADCRAAKSISISNGRGDNFTVTPHEPYIIDGATLEPGTVVTFSVTAKSACSGNLYVARLNAAVFERAMTKLAAGGLNVTSSTDRSITGTVNAAQDSVMFTSIPYDRGWTVKIDGKPVELYPSDVERANSQLGTAAPSGADEAMLLFDVPAGEHTVELTFFPRGLALGLGLSAVSLAALLFLLFLKRKEKRARTLPLWETEANGQPSGDIPPADMTAEEADVPADTTTDISADVTEALPDGEPETAQTPPADVPPADILTEPKGRDSL